ncbi:MAG: Dam family site-specific DNA-(adenine-N6)-methyltransferase [Syntrophobacteraceae bacterium]
MRGKQIAMFNAPVRYVSATPFSQQLLKWIGNKQKYAPEIISYFPRFGTYYEPFLGSGGVLATLAPKQGVASDCFKPLMEIWRTLRNKPEELKRWYKERHQAINNGNKIAVYEQVKAAYNAKPNGADLLFLCRVCYGGVVRFRQADGYMSTPCGVHSPMPPDKFAQRVDEWSRRVAGTTFLHIEYEEAMNRARPGDMIYCDPPYSHSQAILYGAQSFSLENLFKVIERCKKRGVYVALSIDGKKRSGDLNCKLPIPNGLFEREIFVRGVRSMLKRFQMEGQSLEKEVVSDRLLLTY